MLAYPSLPVQLEVKITYVMSWLEATAQYWHKRNLSLYEANLPDDAFI